MDPVVEALAEQQAETTSVVDGLTSATGEMATRCIGWSIADVVLHLAQSDEMAVASLTGQFGGTVADNTTGWGEGTTVDESVAAMVERERGAPVNEIVQRWSTGASGLVRALDAMDLSTRVPWVAGFLSARTLATTRLAETWIHTGDVAAALGVRPVPTDRLRLIARLAWRTLPYAFDSAGRQMSGPVAMRLVGPSGEPWEFLPDEPEVTTISGTAVDLCQVAARRVDPGNTTLDAEGPDAHEVLALIRTYA